jgi:ketosteroid isomerase-like protein
MLTLATLDRQERTFASAFAAGDITLARRLYDPAVVYLSPTTRLFGWPARIEGVDPALEFIQLTIGGCSSIAYAADERAVLPDGRSAYVRVRFDWDGPGGTRVRSVYVVVYRYRRGRIAQQELYYDPNGPLETVSRAQT